MCSRYLHSTDTYAPLGMVRPPSAADPSAADAAAEDDAPDDGRGEAPADDEEATFCWFSCKILYWEGIGQGHQIETLTK